MSYNNDCSCDANKFYEKYKDRIELILSQNFTDVDNVITPSEESLEEESYETRRHDSISPPGILISRLSKVRRKTVTFTDAVSSLEKMIAEDQINLDKEYDTKELKEHENAKVIDEDKTRLDEEHDTKGLKEDERAKKIIITDKDINDFPSRTSRKSKLSVKRKAMKNDRSFIHYISSLKSTDHNLQKDSLKQSLALLKKHSGSKMKQYEIDPKLKYLTSLGNMAEGEWQGEKDKYHHERILQEVKERMAKYGLYESTSLDEGEDRYSIQFEPKTKEWYSESQRRAEMYLKNHRILELFHFLGSHLTVSNTENPIEFLINLLDDCLTYRNGNDEPPLFFTSKYIKSLFETMDKMNTGVISLKQYRIGMITLGIKDYEKYPKTDANYMVDETTFVTEALVSLKAQLNGLIQVVPTPTASLLWPSEIASQTSLMSA
ncbi:hypothetical protein CBL_09499 [Carabus blaptoides fortunei]